MGVTLEVLLARQAKAWPEQLRSRLSPAVTLPQGLVLVPLTDDVKERLVPAGGAPVLGFDKLTAGVASAAADASHYGPIGYLHQETFGGAGFEASAVWRAGRVAFGPRFTATDDDERITSAYVVVTHTASNAINEALRHLDIDRGAAVDEYAAIGLDRHRTTAAWLSGVGPTHTGSSAQPPLVLTSPTPPKPARVGAAMGWVVGCRGVVI